jgi:hypothetical protein
VWVLEKLVCPAFFLVPGDTRMDGQPANKPVPPKPPKNGSNRSRQVAQPKDQSFSFSLSPVVFSLPVRDRSPKGWSEPTATNAPIEDDPVQPVLRMNILLAQGVFFFHLFSAPPTSPLLSPLLPTTYEPHPPSLHRQSLSCATEARAVELLLWSCGAVLELWNCCCGVGAGVRAPTRPTRP